MRGMLVVRMKTLALLILASAPALPMGGTWQRHLVNSDRFDVSEPHPLAYFTEYPLLLELDPCDDCSPEKRSAQAKEMGFTSEVAFVGTLEGFAIYDVFYRSQEERERWKSILVRTGKDEYREIYHTESFGPAGGSPLSAKIITVGKEQLLQTRCWDGPRSYQDDYWFFDKAGPTIVDFSPILTAARSVLPKGMRLYAFEDESTPGTHYLWQFDHPALTSTLWVLNRDEPYCCSGGRIDVTFRLNQGRVVVTGKRYDPKARHRAD